MKPEDIEALKVKGWTQRADEMTDEDISLASAWEHQQNMYSSRRLLQELMRYHGDKYADSRY